MEKTFDKLDEIFRLQKKLNEDIILKRGWPEYSREEWIKARDLMPPGAFIA